MPSREGSTSERTELKYVPGRGRGVCSLLDGDCESLRAERPFLEASEERLRGKVSLVFLEGDNGCRDFVSNLKMELHRTNRRTDLQLIGCCDRLGGLRSGKRH